MSQARIWLRRLTHRPAGLVATLLFLAQFCVSPAQGAEIFSRQSQWEATLEAAKKEGKVNIYMYRYGKVLDIFRSDYPEIQPFLLTGSGAQIITKIMAERRAGRNLAGCHRTGHFELSNPASASKDARTDSAGADASRSHRRVPLVRRQASLSRSRWQVRLRLPGQRKLCAALLQHEL